MKKLIPLIFAILGTAVGMGAWVLLNDDQQTDDGQTQKPQVHGEVPQQGDDPSAASDQTSYVKLNNQFIVPVIDGDRVTSIIVLNLSLEINGNNAERVYSKEPKLRDGFLQVLFDHSNIGGFHGAFTDAAKIAVLRRSLLSVAQITLGEQVKDVLITNLARQDA